MPERLHYPAGLYGPTPIPDLSDREIRRRLSPTALKAFFRIADRWSLRDQDARDLLGGVSHGAFYEMKKSSDRILDTDMLTRLSLLIGIYKALNVLYSEKLADAWIQLPNTNPLFSGRPPLASMIAGGIPAMQTIRRLLDARRGGV
ncbi:MAG TPA: antitoxin Xre-like helix-turn-helix domain-containing protein [Thermoanaerobaculia bacterium]|jgi:hypothetical protein